MSLLVGMLFGCPCLGQSISTNEPRFKGGVATHLFRGDRPTNESLDALAAAGVTAIREDATWARVEVSKGAYGIPSQWDDVVREANNRGIDVLLVLVYGNKFYDRGEKPKSAEAINAYARYASFVANHFRGRVKFYEVWNEWDGRVGNTASADPESYMKLATAAYHGLKKEDPKAIVLAGSLTTHGVEKGDLKRLIDLGLLKITDGLPLHVYTYCQPDPGPERWREFVEDVASDLKWRGGTQVPVYITETGWSTFTGKCGVDEVTQATYLAGIYGYAKHMPFVRGVWWYDLQDDGKNPAQMEDNFGILRADLSPKPAFRELKNQLKK
jgi:hypothetical protein